jgi:site-specific recombinase XerD
MKGARPLSNNEIVEVSTCFDGYFKIRNKALFMLGVSVGGRISELLSMKVGDVWQNGQAVSDLLFAKDVVKGKEMARMIPVNADGRQAIRELIEWHKDLFYAPPVRGDDPERPLFPSRKHGTALSRSQAHRILEKAFAKAGLNGKLATHSMRKSFAQRIYDASGDIFLVKELLGHKSVDTTKEYLGVSYAKMQRAVKNIELNNRSPILLHSPSDFSTGDLIAELLARGFDVSSIQKQLRKEYKERKVIAL